MKQILRYLKPYLGKLLAATVLIALSTLCDLLLPTWMSAILNGGIAARDFPAIAVRCLQMLAIAAVSLASILGGTRLSTEVVACFCADLRADVFRKVNTLSFEEFGSLGTAALGHARHARRRHRLVGRLHALRHGRNDPDAVPRRRGAGHA